jgi:hypothetical protein
LNHNLIQNAAETERTPELSSTGVPVPRPASKVSWSEKNERHRVIDPALANLAPVDQHGADALFVAVLGKFEASSNHSARASDF